MHMYVQYIGEVGIVPTEAVYKVLYERVLQNFLSRKVYIISISILLLLILLYVLLFVIIANVVHTTTL